MIELVFVSLISFGAQRSIPCEKVEAKTSIQDQFVTSQYQPAYFSYLQKAQVSQLLTKNPYVQSSFNCYVEALNRKGDISSFLAALKLKVLSLRLSSFERQWELWQAQIAELLTEQNRLLNKGDQLSLRVAATIRSLWMDEVNRELEKSPDAALQWLKQVQFIPAKGVAPYTNQSVNFLKSLTALEKVGQNPDRLAQVLSYQRSFVVPKKSVSVVQEIVGIFNAEEPPSLKSQLSKILSSQKNSIDFKLTRSTIDYYGKYLDQSLKQNPFQSAEVILAGVYQGRLKSLKVELGNSWPLISQVFEIEATKDASIPLLSEEDFKKAKLHYAKTKNPLGRALELGILKKLMKTWGQADVDQLALDLSRNNLMQLASSGRSYFKRYRALPSSLDELKRFAGFNSRQTYDYVGRRMISYNPKGGQIWSAGENGRDEMGSGDDLKLTILQ